MTFEGSFLFSLRSNAKVKLGPGSEGGQPPVHLTAEVDGSSRLRDTIAGAFCLAVYWFGSGLFSVNGPMILVVENRHLSDATGPVASGKYRLSARAKPGT
ncbi:MAG: hypothetical protein ABJL67_01000 [Sulfitobacter sp.]